eukprot:Skav211342  [mRNA]  locus=scaffold2081:70213:72489:- [translate_table: standard]
MLRKSALATGCSFWWKFPKSRDLPPDDPRLLCMCGASKPSRAHLVWQCSHTAHLRAQWRLPTTRLEERLFGIAVEECPAPANLAPFDDEQLITALIQDAAASDGSIVVATDGASLDHIGAWSIVVPRCSLDFAHGLHNEDQGAYQAEIWAIVRVLQAALRAATSGTLISTLLVVTDCTSAISAFVCGAGAAKRLARFCRHLTLQCEACGMVLTFQWIPSHNKVVRSWTNLCEFPEEVLRRWNALADVAAKQHLGQLCSSSPRASWARARREAFEWELQTVSMVARLEALDGGQARPGGTRNAQLRIAHWVDGNI